MAFSVDRSGHGGSLILLWNDSVDVLVLSYQLGILMLLFLVLVLPIGISSALMVIL